MRLFQIAWFSLIMRISDLAFSRMQPEIESGGLAQQRERPAMRPVHCGLVAAAVEIAGGQSAESTTFGITGSCGCTHIVRFISHDMEPPMGRRPIKAKAMTDAERQRRRYAKLRNRKLHAVTLDKQVKRAARLAAVGMPPVSAPRWSPGDPGPFNVVYADPPWRVEPYSRDTG